MPASRCRRSTESGSVGCCRAVDVGERGQSLDAHDGPCCTHPARRLTRRPGVLVLANGLTVTCSNHPPEAAP